MLFPPSPIRRYTPPTCTLEIWANRPLWPVGGGRDWLQELRFQLHLDDPRVSEAEQVTVRGDRAELELLRDIVATYVQNFLDRTPRKAWLPPTPVLADNAAREAAPQVQCLDRPPVPPPHSPALKPQGLLAHQICFGSLTTDPPRESVKLSASQLFDLADALEEYSSEVASLNSFQRPQPRKTLWIASTAAAALLAVGLTAVGLKVFQPPESESVASQKTSSPPPGGSSLSEVLPPVPPAPVGKPRPSPTLPPELANRPPLKPPSPLAPNAPLRRPSSPVPVVPPARDRGAAPLQAPPPPAAVAIIPAAPNPSRALPAKPNLPPLPSFPSPPSAGEAVATRAAEPDSAAPETTARQETPTLLDTIPQVAEVRQYFQQRWQVPEGLTQTLEYRLVLREDGSLKRIIPLGKAATLYLDRTQMPLLGESFVSSPAVPGEPTIRLVLSPNGKVKTFLE